MLSMAKSENLHSPRKEGKRSDFFLDKMKKQVGNYVNFAKNLHNSSYIVLTLSRERSIIMDI